MTLILSHIQQSHGFMRVMAIFIVSVQCDNEWGWVCHNSKTVNRASITYPMSGCHLLYVRSVNNFPIHELSTAGSIIKTPATADESTNVFKFLVYIYIFSSVDVEIHDRSCQCQLSLGIGLPRHFRTQGQNDTPCFAIGVWHVLIQ